MSSGVAVVVAFMGLITLAIGAAWCLFTVGPDPEEMDSGSRDDEVWSSYDPLYPQRDQEPN